MILLIVLLTLLLIGNSLGQHLFCPQRTTTECFSTLAQSDCATGEILASGYGICELCPKCVGTSFQIAGLNEVCSILRLCLPGLKCVKEICRIDPTKCLHLNHIAATYNWIPKCDRDDNYKAIQCKGDRASGRCFCFSEQGDRIFGWDWWSKSHDMTCLCSRKRYNKEMNDELSTLHCTQNGNYEELQCENNICWCAEPKTGDLKEATFAVPYTLWTLLPCYNITQMGTTYFRQCESAAIAQTKIKQKLETHGVQSITTRDILCDYDGAYGSYAIDSGSAVCTWRDGSRIGSYQVGANEASTMNCNCARDTKIFDENHLALTMACSGNGNYEQLQGANHQAFCIDRDGYAVTELLPLTPSPECSEFLYYQYKAPE